MLHLPVPRPSSPDMKGEESGNELRTEGGLIYSLNIFLGAWINLLNALCL